MTNLPALEYYYDSGIMLRRGQTCGVNCMESMLKTLIVVTLVYYLVKGLIYLLLWQATYKVQENALAAKNKRKKKKEQEESIWAPDQEDEP